MRAILVATLLLGITLAVNAEDAIVLDESKAEPGLTYGTTTAPLPRTLLFSINPDDVAADAAEWKRRGIDGFFLEGVAGEWSNDIWATDGEAWTIGAPDKTFQRVQRAAEACHAAGSDLFLKVVFAHYLDWFNDTQMQQATHNFRQFAIFARDSGCTGFALDIEYVGSQYEYEWDGYDFTKYSRADLIAKIRERATAFAAAMYDEWPEMIFLTLPEEGLSLGSHVHAAWIEEAARRDAPGGVHFCLEGTYRTPNVRHMFGGVYADTVMLNTILSPRATKYWTARCSLSSGIWPFGTGPNALYEPGMPIEEFRQAWAASLMLSPRYNWIYADHAVAQLIGRKLDVYDGTPGIQPYLDIIAKKEVITTPRYVDMAKAMRDGAKHDWSAELGLAPVPTFRTPNGAPFIWLAPASICAGNFCEDNWNVGRDYYAGRAVNLQQHYETITHWRVIGPFPSDDHFSGHAAVFPPEQSLDQNAEYDGATGKVRWTEYESRSALGSIDFASVYAPSDNRTAYALCYVTSPTQQDAQIRLATNDAGRLWLGGKLVYDFPHDGMAFLDRDVVDVTLPAGATPLLLKVTNGIYSWAAVLRITDKDGVPLHNLTLSPTP